MNYELNEEQRIIKESANRFLAEACPTEFVREMMEDEKGFTPELWNKMAELGWMGLPFPEEVGGAGMSFFDLAVELKLDQSKVTAVCLGRAEEGQVDVQELAELELRPEPAGVKQMRIETAADGSRTVVLTMVDGRQERLKPDELIARIDELTLETSGGFWHANGEIIPW